MAMILCIETSSTNCSVALASEKGGYKNNLNILTCLDLIEDQSDSYGHGERLHVFIQDILKRNSLSSNDLDAIAISKGPGSYTGLRIGVASAKGMCFALDIPLISIDTLQALSMQAYDANRIIIPMMDARRMEVYASVFKNDLKIEKTAAIVLENDSFNNYLKRGCVTIIGSGALKFQDLNKDSSNSYVEALPSALTMCDLAMTAHKKSDIVKDIAYYEPYYLKEFKSN